MLHARCLLIAPFHSLPTSASLQILNILDKSTLSSSHLRWWRLAHCTRVPVPVLRIHPHLVPLARRCRNQVDIDRRAINRPSPASRASEGYSQHMLAAYPSKASLPFRLRLVPSHFNMLAIVCPPPNAVPFFAPLALPNPALPCPPPAPRFPADSSPVMEEPPND